MNLKMNNTCDFVPWNIVDFLLNCCLTVLFSGVLLLFLYLILCGIHEVLFGKSNNKGSDE